MSPIVLPANADSPDATFLNNVRSINNAGLATLVDAAPDVVVKVGRSVCTMLDDGYGGEAVKGNVLDQLSMYGENRTYNAGLFAVYAVSAYCRAHQADSGFNGNY
jgi:Protein of unknown function (DUF732)